jgi:hypothetical protein
MVKGWRLGPADGRHHRRARRRHPDDQQHFLIERFFSKLQHFRRVATRYDELAANFLAMVPLASMRLWLRAYESAAQLSRRTKPSKAFPGLFYCLILQTVRIGFSVLG